MKFLFVNTPHYDENHFLGAPTSLLYACAFLKKNPIASNLTTFFFPKDVNELFTRINNYIDDNVRMVGFSNTSHSHWVAIKCAQKIKAINPNIIIIFGGPHEDEVSLIKNKNYQTLTRWSNVIDIVISGDGEYILEWLCVKLLALEHIQDINELLAVVNKCKSDIGMIRGRGNFDIKSNNSFERIPLSQNKIILDEIPFIDWSVLGDHNFYNYPIFTTNSGDIKKTAQLMTRRGCKGGCKYCSEWRANGTKSMQKVIDEIDHLKNKYNIGAIFFDDSTFTEDEDYALSLCKALIRYDVEWGCLTRFDKVDFEILNEMKRSGCSYIYFGLEQFDDIILRNVGKRIKIEYITKIMDICRDLKIRVGLSLLFGIGETREIALKTINQVSSWVDEKRIEVISISSNCIHPGSPSFHKDINDEIDFDREPPHKGLPWLTFEEGLWHHPASFTQEYAQWIVDTVLEKIPVKVLARRKIYKDNRL